MVAIKRPPGVLVLSVALVSRISRNFDSAKWVRRSPLSEGVFPYRCPVTDLCVEVTTQQDDVLFWSLRVHLLGGVRSLVG